jgi:phage baseplate assembly protein gpV
MSDDLENIVFRMIERWMAARYSERHGLVTSYDPTNHLAKVTFQPDGQESGWLPIETGHVGNGFGIAIGLTPGDGNASGDQVIVRYQEGDFESGKIVQRVHSDTDKPPMAQSGEIVIQHQKGGKIFCAASGQVTVQDGGGGSLMYDGSGNIAVTGVSTITMKVGGVSAVLSSAGFAVTGGKVTHNGVDIGSDHDHTDVQPGTGVSGPPQS